MSRSARRFIATLAGAALAALTFASPARAQRLVDPTDRDGLGFASLYGQSSPTGITPVVVEVSAEPPHRAFDGDVDIVADDYSRDDHPRTRTRMTARSGEVKQGWLINLKVGHYGTDYMARAWLSAFGIPANAPKDAVYPVGLTDSDGQPLDASKHDYVIHFASKDDLPPANGFWSLTMYDSGYFFVPNALDRYTLSERNDLKVNADGWRAYAVALGSISRDADALVAAQAGLALAPRQPDLLRVQALALRALGSAEAEAALDSHDRHRDPDIANELRFRGDVEPVQIIRLGR